MITVRDKSLFTSTKTNVVVRMSEMEEKTKSGIIIPNTANKRTDYSCVAVTTVGDGSFIKDGDRLIVRKQCGVKLETDQEGEYKVYKLEDVLYVY